jgi:hypothetical protein
MRRVKMRRIVKLGVCLVAISMFIASKGRALRYIWLLNYLTLGIDLKYPKRLGSYVSQEVRGSIVRVNLLSDITDGIIIYDDEGEMVGPLSSDYTGILHATGEGYYLVGGYTGVISSGILTATDTYDWHSGVGIRIILPKRLRFLNAVVTKVPNLTVYRGAIGLHDEFWLWLGGKSFTTHINVEVKF